MLSEYDYPNDRYRRNAEEFTKWLECFKDDSLEIKDDIFLSMKNVTSLVVDEMSQMKMMFYCMLIEKVYNHQLNG